MRRDGAGGRQVGPDWESLIERQIREATEAGAFDDLPHQGERLPLEDDSLAGEWAMAHRMLRDAGIAPPWIESDKEARALLTRLEANLRRAPTVRAGSRPRLLEEHGRLVLEVNRAIARVNSEAPTDRQHRRPLDPVAERDRLERAFGPD
jgi:DnaJ homolog subfamily C member 28